MSIATFDYHDVRLLLLVADGSDAQSDNESMSGGETENIEPNRQGGVLLHVYRSARLPGMMALG